MFFYPGVEHVGIYVGNGLIIDAPTTGQKVQMQADVCCAPDYDGAVRIVG